ncbi:MAG: hypothetical protein ACRD06_00580 [Terriglobia bacterium]
MSVFDSTSQTSTEIATGLGKHDYSLTTNSMGGIKLNGMTSDSALSPTVGVDCTLDHGNYWQEIDRGANKQVDVAGTFTLDITGNQDVTITGNVNEEIYGTSTYTYAQSLDSTNVMTVTNNFASVQTQTSPNQLQQFSAFAATYDINFQVAVINTSIALILLQIALQNYQFYVSSFGINAMTFTVNGLNVPMHGLDAKMQALGTKLQGLAMNVGGPKIVGYAAKLLGCAILGPNQVL